MQTIDARGVPCPQPVVMARRAMRDGEPFRVLLDSETAVSNVSRMARASSWEVVSEEREDGTYLSLTPPGPNSPLGEPAVGPGQARQQAVGPLVVLLASDTIGHPDDSLGQILIRAFLHTLKDVEPRPDTIICMNGGVRLAAEGSPALDDLRELVEGGTELFLCGTCLDYYGLKDKVGAGTVSNMYSIAEALMQAGKVLRP
jgi:selenium metabolism protein YedF